MLHKFESCSLERTLLVCILTSELIGNKIYHVNYISLYSAVHAIAALFVHPLGCRRIDSRQALSII